MEADSETHGQGSLCTGDATAGSGFLSCPVQAESVELQQKTPDSYGMPDMASPNGYMDWMLGDLGIDLYGGMMNEPSWG